MSVSISPKIGLMKFLTTEPIVLYDFIVLTVADNSQPVLLHKFVCASGQISHARAKKTV